MNHRPRWLRIRLWTKLAIFGAFGVLVTNVLYMFFGLGAAERALTHEQETLGRSLALVVGRDAAESVLVDDVVALHELVTEVAQSEGIAYCMITRNNELLASSLPAAQTRALRLARAPAEGAPLVLVDGEQRYLDVVQPILEGDAGAVHIGLDMTPIDATRRHVLWLFGVLGAAVILLSLAAAFFIGRSLAHPLGDLVAAADRFDPGARPTPVEVTGSDEVGELAERFNRMMVRLRDAHHEQLLARQKEHQTESMAALGSLVAGVAHEVNNPLAGMKNCVRRLQRQDPADPAKQQEYLELMEQGIDRIEDVMRRLLDFARPQPLRMADTSTRDVIRDGTGLLRPLLGRRHMILELPDGEVRVLADRRQAAQALLNLLLNAIYVTPEGGRIRIELRDRPGLCGIAVADDGPGIPPAVRARVFDPFFTTKPQGEGTGLGLSVTRSILESHGGELTLDSPPRGTVVIMWLRRADTGQPA